MFKKIKKKMANKPTTAAASPPSSAAADEPFLDTTYNEPKVLLSVGERRNSTEDITPPSNSSTRGGGLARRGSSKYITAKTSTLGMQNIYSTPLTATLHYTPPLYPKSSTDEKFISLAIQRNFVFANALITEEESSRKREIQ
mmetsp:Transcript_10710/g.16142  ORF Transcript_10710/g.16142 Transcript_10710/m.16142 type:complete len:142 (-) Transcript_10710:8-433(-)